MEPEYRHIAKVMLNVDKLPLSLEDFLHNAERMVQKVKPNGCLCSTQTIATLIIQWALNKDIADLEKRIRSLDKCIDSMLDDSV